MDKTIFSINVKISKRETDRVSKKSQANGQSSSSLKNNTFSQRFQFKNFNQSAIEEEGEKKIISVAISKPINLNGCNAIQLSHSLKPLNAFVEKLKQKKQEG